MRGRIHGERINAGAAVDSRASADTVRAPIEAVHRARDCRPDLVRRLAEAHAADSAVEYGLYAGGRDALSRRDDTGVANVALWSRLLSDVMRAAVTATAMINILALMLRSPSRRRKTLHLTVALPLQPPFTGDDGAGYMPTENMMCAFGVPGYMIHGPFSDGFADNPVVAGVANGM